MARLAGGATSTALMIAYRGPHARAHAFWAFWRDATHVYIQEQSVHVAELDSPFDPVRPYGHVGDYLPTAVHGLPIPEWHVPIEHLRDALLGFRSP
ncbi:MAG: hypothetical protein ACREPM_17140 [Gemmatimonadaceae bacterium]